MNFALKFTAGRKQFNKMSMNPRESMSALIGYAIVYKLNPQVNDNSEFVPFALFEIFIISVLKRSPGVSRVLKTVC